MIQCLSLRVRDSTSNLLGDKPQIIAAVGVGGGGARGTNTAAAAGEGGGGGWGEVSGGPGEWLQFVNQILIVWLLKLGEIGTYIPTGGELLAWYCVLRISEKKEATGCIHGNVSEEGVTSLGRM